MSLTNPSLRCPSKREEELKREGWIRRFTADEPRLSEAMELYESLGFEVRLEPASFDEANEACKTCLLADCNRYKTIYIRPKEALRPFNVRQLKRQA